MNRHVRIVLPCTNEGEWLRVTVDSILEHTDYPSFEILVMANGDRITDFSFVEDKPYRRRVRLRRVEEALGVGNSINDAVAPGDATYYVFLDAHCLLEQRDWLQRAVASLDENPRASLIQPEVLHFTYDGELGAAEDPDPSRITRTDTEHSIRWAWPYEHPADLSIAEARPASSELYEAMASGGMAVFARAETFHRLGKYDSEVTGWYPETQDYCAHAWMLGFPTLVEPRIRVLHRKKTGQREYDARPSDAVHGVLRTAYRYLSPRRRDLAETLFRRHGLTEEVDNAIERICQGNWLHERAAFLGERIRDDDWLFARFGVYEERFGTEIR